MKIVSTFNPAHWDLYVKRNMQSWLDHTDCEIVCYYEGEQPELEGIEWRRLADVDGLVTFLGSIEHFPKAHGATDSGYNYNFDANKFSRKVFAQCDAFKDNSDYLIWLDSDVRLFKDVTLTDIKTWMGDGDIALFQRPGYHSESGIVFWKNNSKTDSFFKLYQSLYETGEILKHPQGWHDCWAMDSVIMNTDIKASNLTPMRVWELGNLHVVPHSVVKKHMEHNKGNRKYGG